MTHSNDEREILLQRLRDLHRFPGPFSFKVIGENSPRFVAHVLQAVVLVLGASNQPAVTTRQSRRGNHQSVTLRAQVDCAERVLEVYAALKSIPGVRLLL